MPGGSTKLASAKSKEVMCRSTIKCLNKISNYLAKTYSCLGQKKGIEHAIHVIHRGFLGKAIPLIDPKNPFNNLNRERALKTSENFVPQFIRLLFKKIVKDAITSFFIDR